MRMPYIAHIHGSDIRLAYDNSVYEGIIHRLLKRFSLSRSMKALVSTPNLITLAKSLSPNTSVLYLPNPIDTRYFTYTNAQRLSEYFTYMHDGVDLLITMPTRIHFSTKGNDVLVKALALVKPSTSYRLVMVKHGPDLPRLLRLIDRFDLKKRIVFVNPIPNKLIPGLYGVSDIVVAAISKREVFGITALESMACRIPTVNTWSKKYYVDAEFPALPYGVEPLSKLLENLIEDPLLRNNIARIQARWVRENHDSRIVAMKLVQVYKDLMNI